MDMIPLSAERPSGRNNPSGSPLPPSIGVTPTSIEIGSVKVPSEMKMSPSGFSMVVS